MADYIWATVENNRVRFALLGRRLIAAPNAQYEKYVAGLVAALWREIPHARSAPGWVARFAPLPRRAERRGSREYCRGAGAWGARPTCSFIVPPARQLWRRRNALTKAPGGTFWPGAMGKRWLSLSIRKGWPVRKG